MKFEDKRVKNFVANLFYFGDTVRIYDEDNQVLTRADTIFISGKKNGLDFNIALLRSKIVKTELVILDISYHKKEIQSLWAECVGQLS